MCGGNPLKKAMDIGQSIINPISNIPGGAKGVWEDFTGKSGIESANEANLQIARENREWQERMSNSAHQREIKDLRKAGINPILSAGGGGASTPAGNITSMEPGPPTKDAILGIINTILSLKQTSASVAKDTATAAKTVAETPDPIDYKKFIHEQAEKEGFSAKGTNLDLSRKETMKKLWDSLKETQEYYGLDVKTDTGNRSALSDTSTIMKYLLKALVTGQPTP